MIKNFTLSLLCLCGTFTAMADGVSIFCNDTELSTNSEITIYPVKEDLGSGYYTFEAASNPATGDNYYIVSESNANITGVVSVESKEGEGAITWCLNDKCENQFPLTKTFSVVGGDKTALRLDANFTNNNWGPEPLVGKVRFKLVLTSGLESKTYYFNFISAADGVSSVATNNTVKVANNSLIYNFENDGNYTAHIYTVTGQEMKTAKLDNTGSLSLDHLSNGLYIYVIRNGNKQIAADKILIK